MRNLQLPRKKDIAKKQKVIQQYKNYVMTEVGVCFAVCSTSHRS
jgi:hypothetical protein